MHSFQFPLPTILQYCRFVPFSQVLNFVNFIFFKLAIFQFGKFWFGFTHLMVRYDYTVYILVIGIQLAKFSKIKPARISMNVQYSQTQLCHNILHNPIFHNASVITITSPSSVVGLVVQVRLLNLLDDAHPVEHLGHGFGTEGRSGVPYGAVRNTRRLRHEVEPVITTPHRLRAEIECYNKDKSFPSYSRFLLLLFLLG